MEQKKASIRRPKPPKTSDDDMAAVQGLAKEIATADPTYHEKLMRTARRGYWDSEVEDRLADLLVHVYNAPGVDAATKLLWSASLMLAVAGMRGRDAALQKLAEPENVWGEFDQKSLTLRIKHWGAKMLAGSFAESLKGAKNFITLDVTHPEEGGIEVTIKRKHGKSTAEVLADLRAENANLRSEVNRLKGAK